MYRGSQTKVCRAAGESGSFNVDVVLHQGSTHTYYAETIDRRESEGGMRVSWPKTKYTDFAFEHNEQGIREPSL